jgi:hypothetical protein
MQWERNRATLVLVVLLVAIVSLLFLAILSAALGMSKAFQQCFLHRPLLAKR